MGSMKAETHHEEAGHSCHQEMFNGLLELSNCINTIPIGHPCWRSNGKHLSELHPGGDRNNLPNLDPTIWTGRVRPGTFVGDEGRHTLVVCVVLGLKTVPAVSPEGKKHLVGLFGRCPRNSRATYRKSNHSVGNGCSTAFLPLHPPENVLICSGWISNAR